LKKQFRSCANYVKGCGIFDYHWWTTSINPRLLFYQCKQCFLKTLPFFSQVTTVFLFWLLLSIVSWICKLLEAMSASHYHIDHQLIKTLFKIIHITLLICIHSVSQSYYNQVSLKLLLKTITCNCKTYKWAMSLSGFIKQTFLRHNQESNYESCLFDSVSGQTPQDWLESHWDRWRRLGTLLLLDAQGPPLARTFHSRPRLQQNAFCINKV